MSVTVKYLLLSTAFVFFSFAAAAQTGGVKVSGEKFLFFKQALDSMPTGLKKGMIKKYPVCKIPAHDSYQLNTINIPFSGAALNLPGKYRNGYINMYALSEMANDCYMGKKYDSASWYWDKALDTAIAYGFGAEELHNLRIALNHICFLKGDYTRAMRISAEGLAKAEQLGDVNRMAHFNNVIGYIYMKLRDTTKAGFYFRNHLKNARSINDSVEVAHALYNLGDLAITEKKYDEAIGYFTLALDGYAAIKVPGIFDRIERKAFISNKLAQCWKLKGNLPQALQYTVPPLAATNMTSSVNPYDKADFFINAGDIYNRMLIPDSALKFLRKGLDIAVEIDHQEFKRDAYEQLALVFSRKKIYDSAFVYQQLFSKLKDSIAEEISSEEIYQRDADLQIERQEQVQKIALERQRLWRNIIIGVAALLLLTVIFLLNRYQLKQKNRYQQELNRQQNELFNAIAAAQDQERKRIAQDLHDTLGSVLSAAKLKLAAAKELKPEWSREDHFQTGISLIDEASAELRNISHNIMPAALSRLGLVAALKNLSTAISSNSNVQISFSSHDFTKRLDEQKEISIYRIILELINNAVKHAQASLVTVQLIKYPGYINIMVEDNGKGFDYKTALSQKKGIGLGNIISRVEFLKGEMDVDSKPGRGTSVFIDVPLI
ncbi:MAG: sensor histidine kinase [Sphingobacteriales bacterium]|nr:sensor histidine kinase [Sphingobacteriales bacterium]